LFVFHGKRCCFEEREEPGQRRVAKRIKERRTRGKEGATKTNEKKKKKKQKRIALTASKVRAGFATFTIFPYNRIYDSLDFFILSRGGMIWVQR